jgi:hypothetical protein
MLSAEFLSLAGRKYPYIYTIGLENLLATDELCNHDAKVLRPVFQVALNRQVENESKQDKASDEAADVQVTSERTNPLILSYDFSYGCLAESMQFSR